MALAINLLRFLSLLLSIYALVVVAAAVVSWVRPDPNNPIVRFLRQATEPAFVWTRRHLPSYFGGMDLAPLWLLFGIFFLRQVVVHSLMVLLAGGPWWVVPATLVQFAESLLSTYMWIVIAAAVTTWISADYRNPIVRGLHALTEPVLARVRGLLPVNLGGVDLSPMVVIAAILFVQYVVLDGLLGMIVGRPLTGA